MGEECCFCKAEVLRGMVMPFTKREDEYPKMYGYFCPSCLVDCQEGRKTEDEFKKAVGYIGKS